MTNQPTAQFPFQLPVVHEPQLTGCTIRLKLETPTMAFAVVVDQQAFNDGKKTIKEFLDDIPPEAGAQLVGVIQQLAATFLGAEVMIGDDAPMVSANGSMIDVGDRVAFINALNVRGEVLAIDDETGLASVKFDADVTIPEDWNLPLDEDSVAKVPWGLLALGVRGPGPQAVDEEEPTDE